jgi:small-conductance mechanosensitive channel
MLSTGKTPARVRGPLILVAALILGALLLSVPLGPVAAQTGPAPTPTASPDDAPQVPDKVDVTPLARDEQISARLTSILEATGWFVRPEVRVQDGVVFLSGQTETADYKKWAGDLARNTQDVAAVVNQIAILEPSVWDFGPALAGIYGLWRSAIRSLPLLGFSLVILVIFWYGARFAGRVARSSLHHRVPSLLLVDVGARVVGAIVFLLGLYVVFNIAGLTNIALTLLGGTGLLGVALGIAFRDITENFLASIFLSLQNPFHTGDFVEITSVSGFVQALTIRTTILMTLDGNHVQIPNATVYKNTIRNYSTNPNRRVDFGVGIGYDDAIPAAQELALKVLADHPAVLKEPEPWVLVEDLGASTVNLRIYFWLDTNKHSMLKAKSSLIRLIKGAFQEAKISMPDEAREVTFPNGVPVRLLEPTTEREVKPAAPAPEAAATTAEGGLTSEEGEIKEQARQSRTPEEGENLLKS